MLAEGTTYQRLPASGPVQRLFQRSQSSVWAASDHFLSVEFRWFLEHYYRFFYRDVQAIFVRKTVRGQIINIACCFILGICALAIATAGVEGFSIGLVPSGVSLAVLVVNLLRGPTCNCHVVTAAQTRQLRGLRRLPETLRALAELEPRLRSAQDNPRAPSPAPGLVTAPNPDTSTESP